MRRQLDLIAKEEPMAQISEYPVSADIASPTPEDLKLTRRASRRTGLFAPDLLKAALRQAFVMLRPDIQLKNPVMFVVEVGTALTLVFTVAKLLGYPSQVSVGT